MKPKQSYPRVVEKAAADRRCNICLEVADLSEDHVPPQVALRHRDVELYAMREIMQDRRRNPQFSQSGVRFRTICQPCNNRIIGDYDKELGLLTGRLADFCSSGIVLPAQYPYLPVRCRPRAVLQSVLGHLLAAKSWTDETSAIDTALRPCIAAPGGPLPKHLHIYYWLHPHSSISIVRDIGMPSVRNNWSSFSLFSVLKFYPVGFVLTEAPNYEGLPSFDDFHDYPLDAEAELNVTVDHIFSPHWPNNVTNDVNIIISSDSMKDAVMAFPRHRATSRRR